MKKILSLTLALSMIFMVACKDKQKDNSSSKADNINEKPKITELIIDGDFAKNETVFWSTYFNGGEATVSAKNEEMVVHIKNAGQLEYAVQVIRILMRLIKVVNIECPLTKGQLLTEQLK